MARDKEIFLWDALDEETKQKLLHKHSRKVSLTQERFDKDRQRKVDLAKGQVRPRQTFEHIWKEMDGKSGIDLGDGWARIFILNRFGLLQVKCDTRLEEEWLEPLSKDAIDLKDMTVWPKGNLPKGNPWKLPHFNKVVVAKPTWHEELDQFFISFDGPVYREDPHVSAQARARKLRKRLEGKRSKGERTFSSLTFYFGREVIKDPHHEGIWTPRKQMQGRPWERGDPIFRGEKRRVKEFFQPDNYDLDILRQTAKGVHKPIEAKTHLIRRHRREKPNLVPLDIKETVEFWLRSMGLEDHSK